MSTPLRHAGVVLGDLEAGLRRRGVGGLYGAASALCGVLSVRPGLTVWCDGTRLWWIRSGQWTDWPAADTEGAAAELQKFAAP